MKKIFVSLFLLLMLLFSSFVFVSGFDLIVESNEGIYGNGRIMSVNGSGGLHVVYTVHDKLYHTKSVDDGVTWSSNVSINTTATVGWYAMAIDGNDYIFVASAHGASLYFNVSTDDGETWDSNIVTNAYAGGYVGNLNSISSIDVDVSSNNDVYVTVGFNSGTQRIRVYKYTASGSAWSFLEVFSGGVSSTNVDGLVYSNGSMGIYFAGGSSTDSLYYIWVSSNMVDYNAYTLVLASTGNSDDFGVVDVVQSLTGTVHVVYTRENGVHANFGLYHVIVSGHNVVGSQNQIVNDTSNTVNDFSLSCLVSGNLELLYSQNDGLLSAYGLKRFYYSGGSWFYDGILSQGNDEIAGCRVVYQRYPAVCILNSGYSCVMFNNTDDELVYVDSGVLSWYLTGGAVPDSGSADLTGDAVCTGIYSSFGDTLIGSYDVAGLNPYHYMELMYRYPLKANVSAFVLNVATSYYYYLALVGAGLSYTDLFTLYVNGRNVGYADSLEFHDTGGVSRLIWVFDDVELDWEKPMFVVHSSIEFGDVVLGMAQNSHFEMARFHDSAITALNGVHDGSAYYSDLTTSVSVSFCFYLNYTLGANESFEDIPSDDLSDYIDIYGISSYNDMFLEFYGNWQPCYYGLWQNARIIYYLDDAYLESGVNFYRYRIFDAGGSEVYQGRLSCIGANDSGDVTLSFQFPTLGTYYMALYNTTSSGTAYGDLLFYAQYPVTVCLIGVSGSSIAPSASDDDTEYFGGLNYAEFMFFMGFIPFALILVVGLYLGSKSRHDGLASIIGGSFVVLGFGLNVVIGWWAIWMVYVLALILVCVVVLKYIGR